MDDGIRTRIEAAGERRVDIADPEAREIIYGLPYKAWQAMHQRGPAGAHRRVTASRPAD